MYIFPNEEGTVLKVVYETSSLSEKDKSRGVEVDSIPQPESIPGKIGVLKYNVSEGLYHEYVDRPMTPEESQRQEMEALKAENQALNTAVVELYEIVLGGI